MNSLKISIVDDEKDHYELAIRGIMREFPRAQVDFYLEAEEFLESFTHNLPDFVLVDYMLPGMTGLELLKKIKEENETIPVVMATGQGNEDVAVQAMKFGAFDYLVKSGSFFRLIPSIITKAIEYKKIQSDLMEIRQRFRAIFDHGELGVSIAGKDGCFLEANSRLGEILGYDEPELKLLSIADITHEQDVSEDLRIRKGLWSGDFKTYQWEKRYMRKDKKEVWVALTAVAVLNSPGKLKYVMDLVQDITQTKNDEETIRMLYHRFISAQEIERKKIADKLHDDLGQTLTVLKIGLDQLKTEWPSESKEAADRTNGLMELIRHGAETIRSLTYHLRPPILDDLGLIPSIKSLISQIEKQVNISIEFSSPGFKKRLIPKLELAFFRIIEECLTNIVKHSDASQASIHLIHSFPRVIAIVEDNGKGIDKERERIKTDSGKEWGLGLINMKERIKFFKGIFEINRPSGGGTQIRIEIPLTGVNYG